jgi:16S rRNA (uracil1498-N3)-methyltransferase
MEPAYFLVPTNDLNAPVFNISGTEAHHALRVRRVKESEKLVVTDGQGLVADVEVLTIGPGEQLTVKVLAKRIKQQESPKIIVAQALAKGERAELAIEILCEVGVDEIIPWQANRSIVKWDNEKLSKGRDKWQAIAKESTKQSRRAFFPIVSDALDSSELSNQFDKYEQVVVLDPDSEIKFSKLTADLKNNVLLVIGPEGGIDESEMDLFTKAGANKASLGETILRTSTAGGIAVALLMSQTRWVK